jgi:hypothetical protein
MDAPLRHFKYARFQFLLQATDRLYLPEYKGSALRGGFGHAFKKVVCALKEKKEAPNKKIGFHLN